MVERGLGSSLPPAELARQDSALLRKLSAYFLFCRWKPDTVHGGTDADLSVWCAVSA